MRAAPRRPPARKAPNEVARSFTGTQRLKAEATDGENAASSAPKVNRTNSSDQRLHAAAVKAVKVDQPGTAKLTSPLEPDGPPASPKASAL